MCVDVSKIRKGDTLVVEVLADQDGHFNDAWLRISVGHCKDVPVGAIKQHIPAPRPIEVGCTVRHISNKTVTACVKAIVNDDVWLHFLSGLGRTDEQGIRHIHHWERID